MKLTTLLTAMVAPAAAVSSIRPRRINSVSYNEFGRRATIYDDKEVEQAFNEMKFFTNMRMLSMNYEPGMSMGNPEPGMSMDYGMSMGYEPGMSMDYNGESSSCVTPDLTNSQTDFLSFVLDVEVVNDDATFVTDLAQGIVNAVASALNWCQAGSRRLTVPRNLEDAVQSPGIAGLEVAEGTSILANGETCVATQPGATCHVVLVVFKLYTDGVVSVEEATSRSIAIFQQQLQIAGSWAVLADNSNIVQVRPSGGGNETPPACPELASAPFGFLTFSLEVEVLNNDVGFAQDLPNGLVNAVAGTFPGWCQNSRRLMVVRNLLEAVDESSGIAGLQVEHTEVLSNENCTATKDGATCHVLGVVIKYYTNGQVSPEDAASQAYTLLRQQLASGASLQELSGNENIVGLRVQGDDDQGVVEPAGPENTTTRGNPVNGGEGDDSGGFTGTTRTATLTVLGVLTASAVVAALVGYKKISNKNRGRGLGSTNDDDLNSSCEESSIGDQTLQQSVLTADVACV